MIATRRTVLALTAAGLACPGDSFAHRLARSETEVRISDDGQVDVLHSFHVHDAQNALFKAGLIERPDLSPLRARARLSLYVAERFGLKVNGQWIDLTIIDSEISGSHVFVYQSGTLPPGLITVKAGMLRDLISNQINSVNVEKDGRVQTLEFSGDDGPKPVPQLD